MLLSFLRQIFQKNRTKTRHIPQFLEVPAQALSPIDAAITLANAGRMDDAITAYQCILKAEPELFLAQYGLAVLQASKGNFAQAHTTACLLTSRMPNMPEVWTLRATAAQGLELLNDALTSAYRSIALRSDASLVSYIGVLLFRLGEVAKSVAMFERALAMNPLDDATHSNRLFALTCLPGMSRELCIQAHFQWAEEAEKRIATLGLPYQGSHLPNRRLRIGYVSADLRNHPVAAFLEPVLQHHNPEQVEVFCYDCQGGDGDAVTRRLRLLAHHWIDCSRFDNSVMALRIQQDAIDILVDLSGHTAGNRLPVFAMKPAPVQVSWFGYMNTTGLSRMDWRFCDSTLCPPGAEVFYSEKLFRLPVTVVWAPVVDSPEPGALPALRNGYITFGSFNSWSKVSNAAIACWAKILLQTPQSKLRILANGADITVYCQAIEKRFAVYGISKDRLQISGTVPILEFLEIVKQADIALDPFPYNGGTTSFYTLWMGVPIVNLVTPGELGKAGLAILNNVGLGDLCTDSEAAYVDTAVALAHDLQRLAGLRSTLRLTQAHTTVMDAAKVVASVEDAYRAMWHNYLQQDEQNGSI